MYVRPDNMAEISRDELADLDRDLQLDVMRHWFFRYFEDPAESTPHDSREGGYIWIWGGPYDAADELQHEFDGVVDDDVVAELVGELEPLGHFWAPTPEHPSLENAFVDVLASSVPMQTFRARMAGLRQLATIDCPEEARPANVQFLLAASVSALEAYLAERAVRGVQRHPRVLSRFIETHQVFKDRKVPVAAVPKLSDRLVQYAMGLLSGVVWHRLDTARRIFEDAFEGIEWPTDLDMAGILELRHDIVHRAGVTTGGAPVALSVVDLDAHFQLVEEFVGRLEPQLPIDDDTELAFLPNVEG